MIPATSQKSGTDPWEVVYKEYSPELQMAIVTLRMKVPGGWLYVLNRAKRYSWFGLFGRVVETDAMSFVPDASSDDAMAATGALAGGTI